MPDRSQVMTRGVTNNSSLRWARNIKKLHDGIELSG
jgi:hypothetical protein